VIELDRTFLYQAALFLILWAVLKRLVFDRFLEAVKKRDERTAGALEAARKLRDEAASLESEVEAKLAEVRREAARAREEIRRVAEKEERELVESARHEAAEELGKVRARIATEVATARASLEGETRELAERILKTLLGDRG
jgi:F-type H+-transporting ATPase subunit b